MPTGAGGRYGSEPGWWITPNLQEQAGVDPVRTHLDTFTADAGSKNNGTKRGRSGNTAPLQHFHKIVGAPATLNQRADIEARAQWMDRRSTQNRRY